MFRATSWKLRVWSLEWHGYFPIYRVGVSDKHFAVALHATLIPLKLFSKLFTNWISLHIRSKCTSSATWSACNTFTLDEHTIQHSMNQMVHCLLFLYISAALPYISCSISSYYSSRLVNQKWITLTQIFICQSLFDFNNRMWFLNLL